MKKRAVLYDPYFDVMGGGEKHILSILQVLEDNGYEVSVFWDRDLKHQIKTKLNLRFRELKTIPNIFDKYSPIQKMRYLQDFDVLLYVTDGSYSFSTAKKNIVFCMVPNRELYRMGIVNRLKTLNSLFISNSSYTKSWLDKWGINSKVIYPYISDDFRSLSSPQTKKEKIILSVGRFFPHLHAKRHDEIVKAFNVFRKTFPDFKLVMAGGIKEEDKGYLEELKLMADKSKNISIEPNVSYARLLELYRKSKIFWHFAGFGIDEEQYPQMVEHLGMTPLEAMAAGTVPFCYKAGGPKELIKDADNGYLFERQDELIRKTSLLLNSPKKYAAMQETGRSFVSENFSYEVFRREVEKLLI